MSFEAKHRFARIAPRKVRRLADLIRGRFADEALDLLRYEPHRGARFLEKVLRSAIGNAQDPRIKPVSRGMAYMILKRFSHISVKLEDISEL
jgi:large subunit ribosomal protein L22